MKKLLIVESPGKLKTLRQILGRDWILEASVGHTTELASDGHHRLGFDLLSDHVETRYVPRGDRGKKVLSQLRRAVKEAEMVYLATDPDREGEAIAWHLVEQLRLKNYCRVSYTQITEAAVKKAIQNPGRINLALVQSQRARQCLDKLVGFEVSPLLWNSTGGKSAGRVQSSTLHLVCERERERLAFKPEKYWVLKSIYGEGFDALYEPPGVPEKTATPALHRAPPPSSVIASTSSGDPSAAITTNRVRTLEEARAVEKIARTSPHIVQDTEAKEETRYPPPPFITSSLQQMAGARFKYSPKKTMQVAQELYEGVQGKGLITYMRTDSITLSPEFTTEAADWIRTNAPESLPARPPAYKAKGDAQAAHEAIRPTSIHTTPEKAAKFLSPDQLKLYTMIWERSIASQCRPARLSRTKLTIACADTRWITRGMTVIDPGYLKFWKNTEDEKTLPIVHMGQRLTFRDVKVDARSTEPPSRFTEPKLVQLMEKRGIGRPSTYASTITTLKDREYITIEKNFVVPTSLGMNTDETLGKALPDLVNTEFTATMETALDEIAEDRLSWERYLIEWNRTYLEPALESARRVIGAGSRPSFRSDSGSNSSYRHPVASDDRINSERTGGDGISGDSYSSQGSRSDRIERAPPASGTFGSLKVTPENGHDFASASITSRFRAKGRAGASSSRDGPSAAPRAGKRRSPRRKTLSTEGGTRTGITPPQGASDEKIQAATEKARKSGTLPICVQGHGELKLHVSAKGAFYWRCGESSCENWAWHQDLSSERCPECQLPLEKIPSKKVTGGYFLKCKRSDRHADEVVLFRNRQTKTWERAGSRSTNR